MGSIPSRNTKYYTHVLRVYVQKSDPTKPDSSPPPKKKKQPSILNCWESLAAVGAIEPLLPLQSTKIGLLRRDDGGEADGGEVTYAGGSFQVSIFCQFFLQTRNSLFFLPPT